jgi:membrane protease YdiL (CAAX protease family)
LRATWRVLLAVSLLPLVGLVLTLVMGVMGLAGMIVGGPLQAAIFLIVLAGWAWAIDRRPLTDYGLSLSRSGLGDLLAGAGAVVVGHLVWYSLGLAGGWTAIEPAVSASQNLVALGVVSAVLSFGLNVWVQDTVYFAVVLRNAAEGFRSRGVVPGRAALGGLVVGVVVFTAIHNIETAVELTDKLLAGTLFGLLYLATGRLALTIGVHGGMAATTGVLFRTGPTVEGGPSIVAVTETLPGLLGTVSARRMPQLVVAALLLAGYLQWRHGSLSIDTTVTEWVERGGGIIGSSSVPQRD